MDSSETLDPTKAQSKICFANLDNVQLECKTACLSICRYESV
jgi:hypothetical protein